MPDYSIGYETIGTVALLTSTSSSSSSVRHATERALARFARRDVRAVAFTATTSDDNPRLLRQALDDLNFDAIVLVGGEPLINDALQETAGSGIPLGIIPCGAGNDHARQYRIPFTPEEAAEVICDGFVTTTDLGYIENPSKQRRYFGTVMCTGADAHAANRVSDSGVAGKQRWAMTFAQELLQIRHHNYRIEMEGVQQIASLNSVEQARGLTRDDVISTNRTLVIERPLAIATFGNTRLYGAGVNVCPRADHHDGLLDVTLVEKAPKLSYLRSARDFITGNHANVDVISSYRCRTAQVIVGDTDTPTIIDGVPSFMPPVTVGVAPAAGRYIVPAP